MSLLSNNSLFTSQSTLSDTSYSIGQSFTIGLTYIKPLNNWLDMETGLEFFKCEASSSSTIPNISYTSHQGFASIVNIPIGVRANFWKYCFANGGLFFDVDVSSSSPIQSQFGIGSMLGVGVKYNFATGISIFANPYIKVHGLIPVSFSAYNQSILESAIRFGITYHL
jgi:hypothetical protein